MQWKVVLGPAWAEAEGMSDADLASLFGLDLVNARPAGAGDLCPRCRNHPNDCHVQLLSVDSATATPEQLEGRAFVKCLCGTLYWYAAVHALDAHRPMGEASVRAASVSRTPTTGALQIDGQVVPPVVVEEIAATDEVAVVIAPASGTVEQQSLIPTTPPEPLPPTADEPPPGQQMLVVPRWYEEQRRQAVFAATSLLYRNSTLYAATAAPE